MEILSKTKLQQLKKLKLKKNRDIESKFLIEGDHLIEEAIKANYELVIYDTTNLTKKDLKMISGLESLPTKIAVCNKKNNKHLIGKRYLLLDEIQDPGNLGTIIRSALAFNIDTIILGNNSCDLYNQKVIRGTQGAMFHLNIINMSLNEAIKELHKKSIVVYGTNVINGIEITKLKKEESYAIVMGNEGRGLDKDIANLCDFNVYIKTNELSESLNVAMATTIILYELDKR